MCDPFKKFVREFSPKTRITADKFHVLRLATPLINKARIEITSDKRKNPVRKLLMRSRKNLEYFEKKALDTWLECYLKIKEIYWIKESLYQFYRTKRYDRARQGFNNLMNKMAQSVLPEIKKLRKTLMKWRQEILNYFKSGLTNTRVEGYNRLANGRG